MLRQMCIVVVALLTLQTLATLVPAAQAGEAPAGPERHIIYVPYEKLDQVFKAEDSGVFLPYSEFKQLWDFYRERHVAGLEDKPPVPAIISRALYELSASDELVQGTATLTIESLEKDWVRLPLGFKGIALSEATLDGKPVLLRALDSGYDLLVRERGRHTLALKFAAKVASRPGHKGIRFNVPRAALAKVNVTLPEADVKIDLEELVSSERTTTAETTTLSAFLGPTETVSVGWQPKEAEREKVPPLLHARTANEIIVTEGLMRARALIHYDIMRAPAEGFSVLLPADFNLLDVTGQQIKSWDVQDVARGKVLTIELHEPAEKSYSLAVEIERILTQTDLTVEAPRIETTGENIAREIGTVSLAVGEELRLKVEKTVGLARIDLAELGPKRSGGPPVIYAYRYWKPGWSAIFSVEKILPRVQAEVVALTSIDKRVVGLHADVTYTVKDAGIFQLAVKLPANLKVQSVTPAKIVSEHTETVEGEWQTVEILLTEKRLGSFTINIYADRRETDEFADGATVAVPEVSVLNVERETGMVGIAAHASYEVSPTETHENLIKIAKQEFLKRRGVGGAFEFRLAYRYAEHPYSATVTLAKRSPQVTAQVDGLVDIGEDATNLTYTIAYTIRYAGIDEVKFKIDPAAAEGLELDPAEQKDFRIEGPGIRDRKYLGDGVWQVTLDGEKTGPYALTVTAKTSTGSLKIEAEGAAPAAPKVAVPTIEVKETMGIFQETGHFAIWKSPNLEVATTAGEGLEVRDARELPEPLRSDRLAEGFRYLKHVPELSLKVGVITYEYAKVLQALVQESHYDMVVSREGKLTVEAVYSIRNNTLQFFKIVLPEDAEIYGTYVSGEAVSPRKGEGGERLIKIPQSTEQDFTLRLIYQTDLFAKEDKRMGASGRLRFKVPAIREMTVSRLSVRLYLPRKYTYLRFHGDVPRVDYFSTPWERLSNRLGRLISPPLLAGGYRRYSGNDKDGVIVVAEPIRERPDERKVAGGATQITKDGIDFLFMKLGGEGEIRVTYWRTTWWTFWKIVAALVVIAAGVVLNRYKLVRRWYYLVGAFIVIIIFYSFSVAEAWVHLFRWAFIGLVVLALVWLVLALVPWAQNRRAARAAAKPPTPSQAKKGGE